MPVLQAMQLGKQYNGKPALSNLNLLIYKGEIFCLLGQNGAGKTTTINLFLGFNDATSYKACINVVEVKPTQWLFNQSWFSNRSASQTPLHF